MEPNKRAAELPAFSRARPIHAHMAAQISMAIPGNENAAKDDFMEGIAKAFEKGGDWAKVRGV